MLDIIEGGPEEAASPTFAWVSDARGVKESRGCEGISPGLGVGKGSRGRDSHVTKKG